MRFIMMLTVLVLLPTGAVFARNLEPGHVRLSLGVGPGAKMGSRLGGASGQLAVDLGAEYYLMSGLSAVVNLSTGFAKTVSIRLRAGARYRLTDLDLPVSPYGQVQLSMGRLYNVLGANLTVVGIRMGVGADYLLTAIWSAGVLATIDLGGTTKKRSALIGNFELIVLGTLRL